MSYIAKAQRRDMAVGEPRETLDPAVDDAAGSTDAQGLESFVTDEHDAIVARIVRLPSSIEIWTLRPPGPRRPKNDYWWTKTVSATERIEQWRSR